MKMLLAEMLKSRSVRLVLAAGFCILLQAALRFPMIAAIRTLTELTGAERMYLVHEAGRILIPFQLLPAVLAGYLGFRICCSFTPSLRWMDIICSMTDERNQLLLALLEEKRQSSQRREHSENLAHQLHNTAGAGLLLLDAGNTDPERMEQILEKLAKQTEQYLDASVLSSESSGFRYEPVDFYTVACRALAGFPESGTRLEGEKKPMPMYGDAFWLEEMIRSLLENALGFTRGQVRMSIRYSNSRKEYELELSHPGSVNFRHPVRYQSARTGHYGIGLSLADAVAEQHHGTLRIAETDGEVRILVRLPVVPLEI
jgi:signal transduction histidine kinase|uniref:Histidine kinase domain-containing protein n=3 Tax=Faecalibaculum rodentium TaxID=1702221 RepID=A0A140DSB5_9FIRM|nr:hypothetical protein AALO17_04080 [Faecalibaculum rodentium]